MKTLVLGSLLGIGIVTASAPVRAQSCDPRASGTVYVPAKGAFGEVMFEDNWPKNGDLDFNDQVVAYNYAFNITNGGQVSSMQVTLDVLAAGGTIRNGLYLHLPVPVGAASQILLNTNTVAQHSVAPLGGQPELVIPIVSDTRDLFAGSAPLINADPSVPPIQPAVVNLLVTFVNPISFGLVAPFDLYIARTDEPGHEIHRPLYGGTATMDNTLFGTEDDGSTATNHFINKNGLPFALTVPSPIWWPAENVPIDTVYPDIVAFAASGGAQHANWYFTNVNVGGTWQGQVGAPAYPPAVIGPDLPPACPQAPAAPPMCLAGSDPERGSPWVVCRADDHTAWLSANYQGYYHIDQICHQLGYAGFSRFGGTCGNVCGYCQGFGSTSCSVHGNEVYDGQGNCGFDAFGQLICFTVQWQCYR